MDSISELPDALLLKILSLLPTARDIVATMVLSKRWQPLWMMVPRLVYDDSYQNLEYGSFSRFVDKSLFLHEAPVIETLHFRLGKTCGSGDIRVWIRAADKCFVRRLIIEFDSSSSASPAILPRSLYTGCRMLAILKLTKTVLVDVTSPISFPSLKRLILLSVKYPSEEFVQRMLSNCPVLELLYVEQCPDDNVTIFTIRVPSLKTLILRKSVDKRKGSEDGFVIDAPSLERLDIQDDYRGGFCVIENEMPNIVEADVDVAYGHPGKVLSSITSVKHLTLCITSSKDAYPVGSIFGCLVFLNICTLEIEWLNLLMSVLRDAPILRALKLEQSHSCPGPQPRPCWSEPSSVPECVTSSLETLKWTEYEGGGEEKEVIGFILRNGSCLKKVSISSNSTDRDKKFEMIKELAFLSRRSPTCHLTFE
ncbi:putative F-box domain, FBD domain, leucine-rich repeat domain superfamily [Arabidopsis thaliana]|uniref:F-box domain-containing protein n=2 Tax=Arabidopsis TaxID=3701 RepID=A0A178U912_ARATH|nr:F-box domain [Arabidopsis thaliana x Arabidopsis arenosa]OAO89627.1 hypothetical protein AXX17_AT5G55570 [Arabidopsis thaliana]